MDFPEVPFDHREKLGDRLDDGVRKAHPRAELHSFDPVQDQAVGEAAQVPREVDRLGGAEFVAGVMEELSRNRVRRDIQAVDRPGDVSRLDRVDDDHAFGSPPRLDERGPFPLHFQDVQVGNVPPPEFTHGKEAQGVVVAILVADTDDEQAVVVGDREEGTSFPFSR